MELIQAYLRTQVSTRLKSVSLLWQCQWNNDKSLEMIVLQLFMLSVYVTLSVLCVAAFVNLLTD